MTWYPAGSSQPKELICKSIGVGEKIAVDNEGDIFVNGYSKDGFIGVVEIPNGPSGPQPQNCTRLRLDPESGPSGLAVDPKTDDLITLDNTDSCAGGLEGRMVIYRKSYERRTGRARDLGGVCTGGLRLNAESTAVFYGDQSVSGTTVFIRSKAYPSGRDLGVYSGNDPGGFTTIPNTLPN